MPAMAAEHRSRPRANMARPRERHRLLELALNMKMPAIYDTIMEGDRERAS